MPPKQIDIASLDPRQLQSVHEQIESEINNLAQSSVALQRAAGEYANSGRALEQLSEQKEGMLKKVSLHAVALLVMRDGTSHSTCVQISQCFYHSRQPCMSPESLQATAQSCWT